MSISFISIETLTGLAKANSALAHIHNGSEKAIMRAIKRTADGVKTDIIREVVSNYNIKSGAVRESMTVRVSSKASEVVVSGSHIPLKQFKINPGSRPGTPLRANVKRSAGGTMPNAFAGKMDTGHTGVFARVDGKFMKNQGPRKKIRGEGMTKGRQAIKELFGPAIPEMVNEPGIREKIVAGAEDRFTKRIDHEIDRLLAEA